MDIAYTNALQIYSGAEEIIDFLSSSFDVSQYVTIGSYKKDTKIECDTLASYEKYVQLIKHLDILVKQIGSICLDATKHSESFILSYKSIFNKFNIKYIKFLKEIDTIKPCIIQKIGDIVFSDIEASSNKLSKLEELRAKYYKTPELIHLYAYVVQRAINTFFASDRNVVYTLMDFIAEDKTKALSNTYNSNLPAKDAPKKNPPQTRFGLIPQTSNMALKDLLKIILAEEKITVDTVDLDRLSKKHKIGFIVFNSVVNTPADYNIAPLIHKEEASKYLQPDTYGITLKTIDRFKTLKTYGFGYGWSFSITKYNEQANNFYIIETLDNETYRCLAPWLYSNKYSIAKFRVKKILEYDASVPSRALEYNALAIKQSVPNMFTNKMLELDTFEAKLGEVESGNIQHNIIDSVLENANKLIKKVKFKSSNDVSDLLHHKSIVESFIKAVEREFAKDENSFIGGSFPRNELMSSFITSLQTNTRRFAREVHNGYSRNPLQDSDFAEKHLCQQIATDKIIKVLTDAVELVIRLDDNIFTSSYYKYLLLNYTA